MSSILSSSAILSRRLLPGLTAVALLGLLGVLPAAAQTTVYSNDFTAGAGAEWSSNATDTTPGTVAHAPDKFLGQFGGGSTTLTLAGLAGHSTVDVSFDLYMIRSMDGNGQNGGGPDTWSLAENGASLISTNFANYDLGSNTQSFGGADGAGGYLTGGQYAPYTGATEVKTLGYTFGDPEDSVYHLSFSFADPSSTLALKFLSQQSEDINNESWGLDNVVVSTNAGAPVPEASTTVSFGLLLTLGLGGVVLAAKRKKTVAKANFLA